MVQAAPLRGRVVAITRPSGQAEEAGVLIKQMGGVPYYIPAIEIKPLSNPEPVKKLLSELEAGTVDYTVLMSTNGVKYLFEAAEELNQAHQLREGLKKTCVVAVGPKTAEAMTQIGVHVDLVPQKYSGEGLLDALKDTDVVGKKFRMARTSNAPPMLREALTARGADVEEIYVYESGLPVDEALKTKFYEDLTGGRIDALLFGSGLSAKNIFRMLTEKASMGTLRKVLSEKVTVIAIGPTTAQALQELNIKVDVMPQDYLFENALSALARHWATQ
jgi:uroporphyrinogen-III synthase